jgi:hypothetical protein
MSEWPAWDRVGAPAGLAGYVQQDVTRRLLLGPLARTLPGPGPGPVVDKARAIYDSFAGCGVNYVDEPTTSGRSAQSVRPVDQVLAHPGHATCLDVSVAYAGACLDAGLHQLLVVLDSRVGGPSHAVVLVWLDGSWPRPSGSYPLTGVVHDSAPVTVDRIRVLDEVRERHDAPGGFLAIDVNGATWRRGADSAAKVWEAAVGDGAAMLAATSDEHGEWQWGTAVDVGLARQETGPLQMPNWPPLNVDVLTPAYTKPANTY